MARTYGKVASTIWSDSDYRSLPNAETQLLYLALISQPDISACGRLSIALRRWAQGIAGADQESIHRSLLALEAAAFIMVDWDTDEIVVRSFIRHDAGITNPRRLAAIQNSVSEISSITLRDALIAHYPDVLATDTRSVRQTFDTRSPNEMRTQSEPNQQAASSEPQTVSSEQQQSLHESLPPAAADAVEIYVAYRLATEHGIRSPQRYAQQIRTSETQRLATHLGSITDQDTARDIAVRVLGLSTDQAMRGMAEMRVRR